MTTRHLAAATVLLVMLLVAFAILTTPRDTARTLYPAYPLPVDPGELGRLNQ